MRRRNGRRTTNRRLPVLPQFTQRAVIKSIPFVRPRRVSTLQIACELFAKVRQASAGQIKLVADYKAISPRDGKIARFKFAILKGDAIVGFVAVKSSPGDITRDQRRQTRRYGHFGLPVIWVRGWLQVREAAQAVLRIAEVAEVKSDDVDSLIASLNRP